MIKNTKLICSIMLLTAMIVQGTALAVPDVIRLHVIANSDSSQDQHIKEMVRDRIVVDLGPVFGKMNQHEVEGWILGNKGVIADLAAEVMAEAGAFHQVQVIFSVESYPTRAYGPVAYPAGRYKSLRVILGTGEGRNWWCLMFPPLCFVDETVKEKHEDETLEGEKVQVRFWLVDKFSALMRRIRLL